MFERVCGLYCCGVVLFRSVLGNSEERRISGRVLALDIGRVMKVKMVE